MSGEIKKLIRSKTWRFFRTSDGPHLSGMAATTSLSLKRSIFFMAGTTPEKQRSRGFSELSQLVRSQTNIAHLNFNCLLTAAAMPCKAH